MFGILIPALEVFVVNSKASIQCVTLMPEHRTTLCFSGKSLQTSWVLLKWNKNSVCGPASGCQLSGVIFPLLSTGGQTGKLLPLFLPPLSDFLKSLPLSGGCQLSVECVPVSGGPWLSLLSSTSWAAIQMELEVTQGWQVSPGWIHENMLSCHLWIPAFASFLTSGDSLISCKCSSILKF